MSVDLKIQPASAPELDPEFVPALLWNRAYQDLVAKSGREQPLLLALDRGDGVVSIHTTSVLPDGDSNGLTDKFDNPTTTD